MPITRRHAWECPMLGTFAARVRNAGWVHCLGVIVQTSIFQEVWEKMRMRMRIACRFINMQCRKAWNSFYLNGALVGCLLMQGVPRLQ